MQMIPDINNNRIHDKKNPLKRLIKETLGQRDKGNVV